MVARHSLGIHLLHGLGGFAALGGAYVLAGSSLWALLLIPVGLVLLRGCPMCWTLGLVETLAHRRKRDTGAAPLCTTCVVPKDAPDRV